jgi:hypothetical protein
MKLEGVLKDFTTQLSGFGLSPEDMKFADRRLDDSDLDATSGKIEIGKNHGGETYTGYHIQWNTKAEPHQQYRVGAWVYVGTRPGRNQLFHALKEARPKNEKSDLQQYADGSTWLRAYCDPERLSAFDETFQVLIEEWIELLNKVGGIAKYLSLPTSLETNEG